MKFKSNEDIALNSDAIEKNPKSKNACLNIYDINTFNKFKKERDANREYKSSPISKRYRKSIERQHKSKFHETLECQSHEKDGSNLRNSSKNN